ncbi:hypothetical protein HK101_001433 [Irineochytrium annulatum]|nr:hypothetical protein HK101_001433 [Irineochytrium annulatum]
MDIQPSTSPFAAAHDVDILLRRRVIRHGGLKGGADASARSDEPLDPFTQSLTAFTSLNLQGSIREKYVNFFLSHPITTVQATVGISLYLLNVTSLVPTRSLLFHPRLAFDPRWDLHRVATSFLVLGTSLFDVGRSVAGLIYWQAPLEKWLCGAGDVYKEGMLVKRRRNRVTVIRRRGVPGERGGMGPIYEEQREMPMYQWLLTKNKFVAALAISAGVVTAIELVLYRDPQPMALNLNATRLIPSSAAGVMVIFPYALYPLLEHSVRWLWALTDQEEEVRLFGFLPLPPIYLPIVMASMAGFSTWKETLKGLAAALVAARAINIRRGELGAEGEPVIDHVIRLGKRWIAWFGGLGRRVAAGQARGGPGGAPSDIGADIRRRVAPIVRDAAATFSAAMRDVQGAMGVADAGSRDSRPVTAGRRQGPVVTEVTQPAEELRGYSIGGNGANGVGAGASWGAGQRLGD